MGFIDTVTNLLKGNPSHIDTKWEPGYLVAPLTGKTLALRDAGEPVFASEVMGKGVTIKPEGDVIYSPADGVVTMLMGDTLHAVGITTEDGIEVLIHIGIDTVEMGGKGYRAFTKQGKKVTAGSPLIGFDRKVIKQAGYVDTIFLIITNTDAFSSVSPISSYNKYITAGEPILQLIK